MSTRSSSRRLVAGARPPDHSDHAGYNDCRHPVCLGACETRWARAVANREDDRPCLVARTTSWPAVKSCRCAANLVPGIQRGFGIARGALCPTSGSRISGPQNGLRMAIVGPFLTFR